MKNKIYIAMVSLVFSVTLQAQKQIDWDDLAEVTFSIKYIPSFGAEFLAPTFSDHVLSLDGQEVSIVGYFINISPSENAYILSKNPMATCFFCGAAGPETAIELQFDSPQSFKTDAVVSVTGTLKLNPDDVEHFNYIITDCKAQPMQ
jgi:hypothetical protein